MTVGRLCSVIERYTDGVFLVERYTILGLSVNKTQSEQGIYLKEGLVDEGAVNKITDSGKEA